MRRTLGAPAGGSGSGGHHGVDSRHVRPMTPPKFSCWSCICRSIARPAPYDPGREGPVSAASGPARWDPEQYLRFQDERSRPFDDLLARIPVKAARRVTDLGCGPGTTTATLVGRWPDATIVGIDSSESMIERAQEVAVPGRLEFHVGDLRSWEPDEPVDVLLCCATLQWVPGHLDLFPRFVGALAQGGAFAFQVPGNFDQPSHTLLHELA